MTLDQFETRLFAEQYDFVKLSREEGAWRVAETISPKRALAFAEGLILDLSADQTRARIRADPTGAISASVLVGEIVAAQRNKTFLAADMPPDNLTPFYVLASLILDEGKRVRHAMPELFEHTPDRKVDWDDPPS